MATSITCAMCGRRIPRHESYLVRIQVLADPSMPPVDTDSMPDTGAEIGKLLKQMATMTKDELQDQVYRTFEYRLCGRCHPHYLANPLGKPRKTQPGHN